MNTNQPPTSVGKIARYIEKLQLSYAPYQNAQGNKAYSYICLYINANICV